MEDVDFCEELRDLPYYPNDELIANFFPYVSSVRKDPHLMDRLDRFFPLLKKRILEEPNLGIIETKTVLYLAFSDWSSMPGNPFLDFDDAITTDQMDYSLGDTVLTKLHKPTVVFHVFNGMKGTIASRYISAVDDGVSIPYYELYEMPSIRFEEQALKLAGREENPKTKNRTLPLL